MSGFEALEFIEVEVPSVLAAQIPGQCEARPTAIGEAIGSAFGQLMAFEKQHKLAPVGPPRTIYAAHGPKGIEFVVAIPIAAPLTQLVKTGPGFIRELSGCKAMRFTHRGPYANMKDTYGQITAFLKSKGLMKTEADWAKYTPMWEEYLNDPHTTPEADLVTYIYLPLSP